MAAVRRSSNAGLITLLVIFIILMFTGLSLAIWFGTQNAAARNAIVANQGSFAGTVASQCQASGWSLTKQSPDEFGIQYDQAAFAEVKGKLIRAAEFENEVVPVLGWDGTDGVQQAMDASALQVETVAAGGEPYGQLAGLLAAYEGAYAQLVADKAALEGEKADLQQRLDRKQQEVTDTRRELEATHSAEVQNMRNQVAELRKANNDLDTRLSAQRTEANSWRQKHQQEKAARDQERATLEDEVALWRKRYEEAVSGPAEGPVLLADGKVIEVRANHGFVVIQGGKDRDVRPNDTFIVYRETPDGKNEQKAVLQVGTVGSITSVATIAEETAYIVQGDRFVSAEGWHRFQRELGQPSAD